MIRPFLAGLAVGALGVAGYKVATWKKSGRHLIIDLTRGRPVSTPGKSNAWDAWLAESLRSRRNGKLAATRAAAEEARAKGYEVWGWDPKAGLEREPDWLQRRRLDLARRARSWGR
jgi:hypothetical protein